MNIIEYSYEAVGNSKMLFYEHHKSGEAFIVRDPLLNLRELDAIQEEVSGWLENNENTPT